MNESKYRSPKWLRKFIDFEVNTGEDINGKISKKQLRKEQKIKKEEELNNWKKKWRETDPELFKKFYKETFKRSIIFSSEMQNIYNEYIGNFDIWDKYDNWIKEKKRKEDEIKAIEKEIDDLFNRIVSDFSNNRFNDKFSTPSENGKISFHYTFENGDKFILKDENIIYQIGNSRITYKIGLIIKIRFVKLANEITNSQAKDRPSSKNNNDKSREQKNKNSNHPKADIYNKLKETVESRRNQLKNLKKGDPDWDNRESLQNELKVAEGRLKKMQTDYQFENLINFTNFI